MTRHTKGQCTESGTTPIPRRSKWRVWKDLVRKACHLFKEKTGNSTATFIPTIRPATSQKQTIEQIKPSDQVDHTNFAILRSYTAPASCGHVLPIKPAGWTPASMPEANITGPESNKGVDSLGSEGEPWVRTIHIHLDKDQPDLIEPCRCLLDTGSDFNLVSQRTLRILQLSFTKRKGPAVTGLGGAQILPIGSILLSWHMDSRERVRYSKEFLVISDDTPALFDVLLGKHWIRENRALLRNYKVMLAQRGAET